MFSIATRTRKADDALSVLEGCADSLRTVLELCEAYDLDIHVPELPDLHAVLCALENCRARGDIDPEPEPAAATNQPHTGNTRGVLCDPVNLDHDWAFLDLSLPRCHRYGVLDRSVRIPTV